MHASEAIAKRVSTRAYQPVQISEKALQAILKAGSAAPVSSAKYDSMHISVIQNEAVLKEVIDSTTALVSKIFGREKNMDFGAKTLIVISGAAGMMPGIEYANAGCIAENMLIAATDLGIANLVWGGPAAVIGQNAQMQKQLGIPEGFKPLLCISLGYAEDEEPAKEHAIAVTRI